MEIFSGRINTSLEGISDMLLARDESALLCTAREQIELGAQAIVLNCATHLSTEIDDMEWMIHTLQASLNVPLIPDSPNPDLHREALKYIRCERPIVNSTTLEAERIRRLLPCVKEHNARLIVLLHDESGMPACVEDRLRMLPKVENLMREYSLSYSDIYLDPLMFPISVDEENAVTFVRSLQQIRQLEPRFQFICGLDNISYGMPASEIINVAMLYMLAGNNMEAVLTALTPQNAPFIIAMQAMTGQEGGTLSYIREYRRKRLNVLREDAVYKNAWLQNSDL